MERQKICLVGWYGHGNCGDESYKISFPKLFPQYDFVFSEKPEPADAYILGGGDIVCDSFINSLKSVKNKHIISAAISKPHKSLFDFASIAARDLASIANATDSGVIAKYVPDFAFALSGDAIRGRSIIQKYFANEKAELYSKVVAVVINSHLLAEHQGLGLPRESVAFEHATYQIAQALDHTSASFIFLPFGTRLPWDDRVSNAWVAKKCKFFKKNTIVYDALSVQDTIDVIAACDGLVSTRLHSTIFACVTATPFIDVLHNHKNRGFLDTVGLMHNSLNLSSLSYDALHHRLSAMISGGVGAKEELIKVATKQQRILKEFTSNVRLFG